MFSNSELAGFINSNFEPVWQNVRDVPTITIDFGGGNKLRRTLNGNVASYVCTADGKILDILPGVYEPGSYKDRLEQLCLLNEYIAAKPLEQQESALAAYHNTEANLLKQHKSPARFLKLRSNDPSSIKLSEKIADPNKEWTKPIDLKTAYNTAPLPKGDLANWKQLLLDVQMNETEMRRKIHNRFASDLEQKKEPTVLAMTKWIYRDVLHTDLDDPYLGLKPVLDGVYPFAKENGPIPN